MKDIIDEDSVLNELIFEEKSSNPDLKFFRADSKIYFDFVLANKYKDRVNADLEEIKFTPKSNMIAAIVTSSLFLSFIIYKTVSTENISTRAFIVPIFIAAVLIFTFVSNFLNKHRNITIAISSKGISFNNFFYNWIEVKRVLFIKRRQNRDKRWFLIIHSNDGTFDRYDIENIISFKNSAKKIAAYITFFRKA